MAQTDNNLQDDCRHSIAEWIMMRNNPSMLTGGFKFDLKMWFLRQTRFIEYFTWASKQPKFFLITLPNDAYDYFQGTIDSVF